MSEQPNILLTHIMGKRIKMMYLREHIILCERPFLLQKSILLHQFFETKRL